MASHKQLWTIMWIWTAFRSSEGSTFRLRLLGPISWISFSRWAWHSEHSRSEADLMSLITTMVGTNRWWGFSMSSRILSGYTLIHLVSGIVHQHLCLPCFAVMAVNQCRGPWICRVAVQLCVKILRAPHTALLSEGKDGGNMWLCLEAGVPTVLFSGCIPFGDPALVFQYMHIHIVCECHPIDLGFLAVRDFEIYGVPTANNRKQCVLFARNNGEQTGLVMCISL